VVERSARTELAEAEDLAAKQRAAHDAVAGQVAAIDGSEAARVADYQRSVAAVATYREAIEATDRLGRDCQGGEPPADAVALHVYLAAFEASAERDAALARLEVCRKILVRDAKTDVRRAMTALQRDFAEAIEDSFDENNPYSRGQLTTTVTSDVLVVRMKGNFEGRRRHSQEQVDAWCASTSLFTRITLNNAHGTFTCVPSGSPAEIAATLLADEGLLPPWSPAAPGSTKVPSPLPPPPPANGPVRLQLAEQAAALRSELEAAEEIVSKHRDHVAAASAARAQTERREEEVRAEGRRVLEESARDMHRAGLVVGAVGSFSVTIGAYLGYARLGVRSEIERAEALSALGGAVDLNALEAKEARQTMGLGVAFGVGIPLIAAGVLLLVLGKQRKGAASIAAIRGGGLGFRF
jgi:hypothetical protein